MNTEIDLNECEHELDHALVNPGSVLLRLTKNLHPRDVCSMALSIEWKFHVVYVTYHR